MLLLYKCFVYKVQRDLAHRSLSGNASGYLADDCQLIRRPSPMSNNCVLPTLEHSLSVGRPAVLETGPLPPQDHKSGTVCRPISDYVGCHTASSSGYWRHFYSDSAQCELFLTAPDRNILTYLLIYLLIFSVCMPVVCVGRSQYETDSALIIPTPERGILMPGEQIALSLLLDG